MPNKIEEIYKKFFETDQERKDAQIKYLELSKELYKLCEDCINSLYQKDIRLYVFFINETKKILHCGLFSCCSHKSLSLITKDLYNETKSSIEKSTGYIVIWET